MLKLNIHEAKTHLSKHLAKLREGEAITLCKRNVPIAEIRLLPRKRKVRPLGLARDTIVIHDSFFDPMSDEELDLFEGKS